MSQKTKRVLVPVGFSEQSIRALDQAVIVAKSIGAEVVAISIIESNTFWEKLFNKERDLDTAKEETYKALIELTEEREKSSGVRIEPLVARGLVDEEIARAVDMLSPEIVIMGTNGRPENFGKKILGSNAYRVVKRVKEPVIVMKGERGFESIKIIAFPVILDRKSKEKVGECLHWARIWGAAVKIVAVANDEKARKKLAPHVLQVHEFITKHNVPATWEIIDAEGRNAPDAVLHYCDVVNADVLMIMDDDDDDLIGRMTTSEVEQVLYNAEIPVMCVTPRPALYGSGFQAI
jgi:nucleotide-binding universal stress UspA family protein